MAIYLKKKSKRPRYDLLGYTARDVISVTKNMVRDLRSTIFGTMTESLTIEIKLSTGDMYSAKLLLDPSSSHYYVKHITFSSTDISKGWQISNLGEFVS